MSAEAVLSGLRWQEASVIVNYEGDRVWLKACFLNGERIGITDCCLADDPCKWHESLGKSRGGLLAFGEKQA